MAWIRSAADGAPDTVPYYTVGGRKCGPFLTALRWSCLYLAGEDDGVVPMDSSHKPGATIVAAADDGWLLVRAEDKQSADFSLPALLKVNVNDAWSCIFTRYISRTPRRGEHWPLQGD